MQLVKWMFNVFVVALILINGALTIGFGWTYLAAAFGVGLLAAYAGAGYAALIFDAAYLVWFWVYMRAAESTGQRSVAGLMAGLALGGSIMATINQLAVNSFGLVDLSAYHDVVGTAALSVMLVITALHIIATAGYVLLAPKEQVRQKQININAEALELTLSQVEKDMKARLGQLADIMTREGVADVMFQMGFDATGKRLTSGNGQRALTDGSNNEGRTAREERKARIDDDPSNDVQVYRPYDNVRIFDESPNGAGNFTTGNGHAQ